MLVVNAKVGHDFQPEEQVLGSKVLSPSIFHTNVADNVGVGTMLYLFSQLHAS